MKTSPSLKKVYIIPGRGGHADSFWYPWLIKSLEKADFTVTFMKMPNPDEPKKADWMSALMPLIPEMDTNTCLIGHSVGCQAALRFLSNLPSGSKISGVVLVAGWVSVPNWQGRSEKEKAVLTDWMNPPIDFSNVTGRADKFTAIFSDDDQFVPRENWAACEQYLNAGVIIKHNFGHFESEGLLQLPEVVDAIISMSK